MFSQAGKTNFLRGQDEFFQTANQSITVRHLSLPYNEFLNLLAGIFFQLYIATFIISKQNKHTKNDHDMKFNSGR